MKKFYTPENFNQEKYKRTSWSILLTKTDFDNGQLRLIVRVATGRKYWPIFSVIPNFELGTKDPSLKEIKFSLNLYSHPLVNRFIDELNVALTDLYQEEINLHYIKSDIKKEGFYSSNNF